MQAIDQSSRFKQSPIWGKLFNSICIIISSQSDTVAIAKVIRLKYIQYHTNYYSI